MADQARLEVRVDPRELVRFSRTMELWARDQLPFATAAALTDTAKDATSYVRNGLVESFKVRNPGLRNGIQFEPADKRGRPITAKVGVRPWASFLVFHAIGGLKRAKTGRVAVPSRLVQRTSSGRVAAKHRPRKLREKKSLIQPLVDERGLIALKNRKGVTVFYRLVASARIEPRWPFQRQVEETVSARLGQHFNRRAEEALRTAR